MTPRYASLALLTRALAHWPTTAVEPAGRLLGRGAARLAPRRRRIALRNLQLCFPELNAAAHAALLHAHFAALGIGALETARTWCGDIDRQLAHGQVSGVAALASARADSGVLLLGLHNTTMEVAAALLGGQLDYDATYRRHRDGGFDALQRSGREGHVGALIERRDVRGMARALRNRRVLWYAADQDYGADHALFAPFFGLPAATITAPLRLARMGRARIAFVEHWRDPGKPQHHVLLHAPVEDLPSGDDARDAARINAVFEAMIRRHPEQYLWTHRRFKTAPPTVPSRYPDDRSRGRG